MVADAEAVFAVIVTAVPLIRWKGYGPEDDQWQRRSELIRTAPKKVADFDGLQVHVKAVLRRNSAERRPTTGA